MTDKTPAMPELPEPDYWSTRDDDTPLYTADQMRAYALAALQSAQPSTQGDTPAAAVSDAEIIAACADIYLSDYPQGSQSYDLAIARAILALRPQADHPDTARCIKARNDLNAALHGEGALIDDLEHAVANACAILKRRRSFAGDRADFEEWMSEGGKWPKAVERGQNGDYLLLQTATSWATWQACASLRPQAVPMTDEQRREDFMAGYEAAEQDATVCQVPPFGWRCTRKAGHEGPCAAVETNDAEFVQRGMDRLRESHHGITQRADGGERQA